MEAEAIRAVCGMLGGGCSPDDARALLAASPQLAVPAGGTVVREGTEGTGLYFLLAGRVEVLKERPDGAGQRLAIVEAPSILGELSLVTDGPHTATARALTDCQLRVLGRSDFRQRLAAGDLVAYKLLGAMADVLARRLIRINQTVLELSVGGAAGGRVEELDRLRQKLFSEWAF